MKKRVIIFSFCLVVLIGLNEKSISQGKKISYFDYGLSHKSEMHTGRASAKRNIAAAVVRTAITSKSQSWAFYSSHAYFKNAKNYLITPTAYGSTQANHPDMVYVPQGFEGYKYWIAYTSYPYSIESLENPHIMASNDGIHFVLPRGGKNPVVPPPADARFGGHLSDTDLMLNNNQLILHCVYNKKGVRGPSKFYRVTSRDGVHWSKPELVYLAKETVEGYSPAFVTEGSIVKMWFVGGEGNFDYTKSSDNEKTWDKVTKCNINMGVWRPWHVDVIKTNEGYEGLLCARDPKLNTRALFYIKSTDGVNWKASQYPILFPSKNGWDSVEIYRSTMIKDSGNYKIWYSARGRGQVWHIGYLQVPQKEFNKIVMG